MAAVPPAGGGVDNAAIGDMMKKMQAESLEMQMLQMTHSNAMEKISGLAQANKGGDEAKKQIINNFK